MTSITSKLVFIHIPKTGGIWVSKSLENSNLVIANTNRQFVRHATYKELQHKKFDVENKLTFSFIRNPVTWYQSRWSDNYNRHFYEHFTKFGKHPNNFDKWTKYSTLLYEDTRIRNEEEYNNFNVWLKRVLQTTGHGWLESYYKLFLGKNFKKVNFIGKTENLTTNTIKILTTAGEKFDEATIRNYPKKNESDPHLNKKYNFSLLKEVIRRESKFMIFFKYSTNYDHYRELLLPIKNNKMIVKKIG